MSHRANKFKWENFILFSEHLHQNNTFREEQTINRVISSRCYYGAFKPFEDHFKHNRIHLPTTDIYRNRLGSHDRVIYYIENNISKNIGRMLKRLKTYRIIADYQANKLISLKDRENAIRLSKDIYSFFTSQKK